MDSEPFINYLLLFGSLNQQQIDLIRSSLTFRSFKTGEYLIKAGQIPREIAFVVNGVLRVTYYDENGNEVTRYFISENNFAVDIDSYTSGIPTTTYVQAILDCDVLFLSKEAMDNLSKTILIWDSIFNKAMIKALAEKSSRISLMLPQDATQRYSFFLEKFPNIANRIPLQYIASYIGVTKHSFSRIRKNNR